MVFVGIAVLTRYTDRIAATEWLYYRSRYDELDVSDAEAVVIRLARARDRSRWARSRSSPWCPAPAAGSRGWAPTPWSSTCSTASSSRAWSTPTSRAGRSSTPTSSLALTTVGGLLLALLLAWRPLASRLQDVVDPFGYAERHARHAVAITAVATEDEPGGPVVQHDEPTR